MRSILISSIGALILMFWTILPATAQPRTLVEGQHFQDIPEIITSVSDAEGILVTEMFWYGCPQCNELQAMTDYWREGVGGHLSLQRIPAIWNEQMATHAQLFFAAKELGLTEAAHRAAFNKIHTHQQALSDENAIASLFADLGVSKEAFHAAWASSSVQEAMTQARQLTQQAGVDRLPDLVVNGRYRVTRNQFVPDLEEMIIVNNELISLIRQERLTP